MDSIEFIDGQEVFLEISEGIPTGYPGCNYTPSKILNNDTLNNHPVWFAAANECTGETGWSDKPANPIEKSIIERVNFGEDSLKQKWANSLFFLETPLS